MRAERITSLLQRLGCTRISSTDTKVRSSCPLAPFRHSSGKDSHPSFVVFVEDNDESHCRCLGGACNFRGSLIQLAWAYSKGAGVEVTEFINYIRNNEEFDATKIEKVDLGIFSMRKDLPGAVEGGVEIADSIAYGDRLPWLEGYLYKVKEMQDRLNDESMAYLHGKERNITDVSIREWELGWHPGARRISVPQFDWNRRLVNIGGRYVEHGRESPDWKPIKWMHATGFKKEYFLFGEDKFTSRDGRGTIVLCEGMFDAIYLYQAGIRNVAAVLGAHLNQPQYHKVVTWFNRAVIVPDGDIEGYKAADRIVTMLGQKIEVCIFKTPMGKDPDQLTDYEIASLREQFSI